MNNIECDVRGFIKENFILDGDELPSDASLTSNGVIDSMGVLELVMFIEENYGLRVPDEDTVPENLDSVERIVRYVSDRVGTTDG